MSSRTRALILLWIVPVTLVFGLLQSPRIQTSNNNNVNNSPVRWSRQSQQTSSSRVFQQKTTPRNRRYRGVHAMKPFWKSSSSSDNEKSNDEEKEDSEPSVVLPSEEVTNTVEGNSTATSVTTSESSNTNTTTNKSTNNRRKRKGFLDLIHDVGQNFKPMAEKATARGYQTDSRVKKIMFALQACVYYYFFILYRAYRGLFILVPAVFRQVYRKMELAMNSDLSLLETSDGLVISGSEEKMNWRTKLTVSVLASVVTASYVLGAAFNMTTKFIRTITKSRSVPKSFEAAADELLTYEDRVGRIGKINGDKDMEPGGFSP